MRIKSKSVLTKTGLLVMLFAAASVSAQVTQTEKPAGEKPAQTLPSLLPQKTIKPYKEVITAKAKTNKGLFTVHKLDDKYFFEIADSLMKREFIAITRYIKTPAGGGYGGEIVNQNVLYFEKGPENKVLLRSSILVNISSDPSQPLAQAVRNSNENPIVAVFDVKALGKDSTGVVIDVTDFFKSENAVISMDNSLKTRYKLTAPIADRIFLKSIHSYPVNTEIKISKTYGINNAAGLPSMGLTGPGLAAANAGAATFEFNISMLLLPKEPMKRRAFDARVGFFADDFTSFDENKQGSVKENFAVRWRLEPKPGDVEKMKRGELVEPAKPIVYYIDPATPKKWRKYLIKGIEDWSVAFEQAGFKNAIRAYEWPEKDTTMSLEDARFSVIRYYASDVENASGPNVHDPRSGEILESHVNWYNDIVKRLYKWYLIQTAAIDSHARDKEYSEALMGRLMQYVICHEVGHTLGLRHNFASSWSMPVDKLRDKEFVKKYGQCASIMDYARFNYVAQPEDGISDLIPIISVYDKWAIEWGYKPVLNAKNSIEEKAELNKWVISHTKDPMYLFGSESSQYDPRFQSEDLGDNAMKAGDYGIKNLKRILPHLIEWTKEEGDTYENLSMMYGELTSQFSRYMGHVAKNIGGVYETPKTFDMPGAQFEAVPKAIQKEALSFLSKQIFETPYWLMDKNIMNKISHTGGVEAITSLQENALSGVLSVRKLNTLSMNYGSDPSNYSVDDLLSDLKKGIWGELVTKKPVDFCRRNLQKVYVDRLIGMLDGKPAASETTSLISALMGSGTIATKSDVYSLVKSHLKSLMFEMKSASAVQTDRNTKLHWADLAERIDNFLNKK